MGYFDFLDALVVQSTNDSWAHRQNFDAATSDIIGYGDLYSVDVTGALLALAEVKASLNSAILDIAELNTALEDLENLGLELFVELGPLDAEPAFHLPKVSATTTAQNADAAFIDAGSQVYVPAVSAVSPGTIAFTADSYNGAIAVAENSDLVITGTVGGASTVSSATISGPNGQSPSASTSGNTFSWSITDAKSTRDDSPDGGIWTVSASTDIGTIGDSVVVTVPQWEQLKIGAGGFVTGVDGSWSDDTVVFRTDTSGAYKWDAANEKFIDLTANVPLTSFTGFADRGCFDIVVADSNSDVMYMLIHPDNDPALWRTADGGVTWTKKVGGLNFDANKNHMRLLNQHMDVDPFNPDHVIFSDYDGLYRSTDGGDSYSTVLGTPGAALGVPGYSGVKFNRFGPTSGSPTITQQVIANRGGSYWYSSNGGSSWSDVTGTSDMAGRDTQNAEWTDDDKYICVSRRVGGTSFPIANQSYICRYTPGSGWETLRSDGALHILSFAPDRDADLFTATRFQSVSHGMWENGSWLSGTETYNDLVSLNGLIPWHSGTGKGYLSNDSYTTRAGRTWWAGGNSGIAYTDWAGHVADIKTQTSRSLTVAGEGVEQICVNEMHHVPGSNNILAAFWDETGGVLDATNVSFPTHIDELGNGFGASWGAYVSPNDPDFWIIVPSWDAGDRTVGAYYTTVGTYESMAELPNTHGLTARGLDAVCCGVPASTHGIVVLPQNGENIKVTRNLGSTWSNAQFGAPVNGPLNGDRRAYYTNRHLMKADPENAGRIWYITVRDDASQGVWRSDNYGSNWSQVYSGLLSGIQGEWAWNAQLEVPIGNHLYACTGPSSPSNNPTAPGLMRSTNGGSSWTEVAGTAEFSKIAFGPIGPQSYPVFYGMGFVDGEWASWMSPNINVASPTWIKIGFYPYDNVADARCMEGNKDSLGVVYVGLSCSGAAYGDFSALIQ